MVEPISIHAMPEAKYDAKRAQIRETYGDSGIEASALRDRALAKLYAESCWTQEQLAKKEGVSQPQMYRQILFGRFLNFIPAGINCELPPNFTERWFRKLWDQTKPQKGNDELRFIEVRRMVQSSPTPPPENQAPLKGNSSRSRSKFDKGIAAANVIAARGETPTRGNVAKEAGVGDNTAHLAIAAHRTASELRAQIDEEALAKSAEAKLPKSSKERLDIALRHRIKEQDSQFVARVQTEVQRQCAETWEPYYNKKLELYETVVATRTGIFTKAQYNKIISCLHPDHVASLGEEVVRRHNEAFVIFRAAELKLVDENESPQMGTRPWTIDELNRFRRG